MSRSGRSNVVTWLTSNVFGVRPLAAVKPTAFLFSAVRLSMPFARLSDSVTRKTLKSFRKPAGPFELIKLELDELDSLLTEDRMQIWLLDEFCAAPHPALRLAFAPTVRLPAIRYPARLPRFQISRIAIAVIPPNAKALFQPSLGQRPRNPVIYVHERWKRGSIRHVPRIIDMPGDESRLQRWILGRTILLGRCPRLRMNAAPLALNTYPGRGLIQAVQHFLFNCSRDQRSDWTLGCSW